VGLLKSLYNGYLKHKIIKPLSLIDAMDQRTERLEEKQDQIAERQERQVDATIALVESHERDMDFDLSAYKKEFGRKRTAKDFIDKRHGDERTDGDD
jgi:BioD-like phosphotransacetylase family protein